jgi:hypothetical protein
MIHLTNAVFDIFRKDVRGRGYRIRVELGAISQGFG